MDPVAGAFQNYGNLGGYLVNDGKIHYQKSISISNEGKNTRWYHENFAQALLMRP